jgi:hypothetical protein
LYPLQSDLAEDALETILLAESQPQIGTLILSGSASAVKANTEDERRPTCFAVSPRYVDGLSGAMKPHGDFLLRLRQRDKNAVR